MPVYRETRPAAPRLGNTRPHAGGERRRQTATGTPRFLRHTGRSDLTVQRDGDGPTPSPAARPLQLPRPSLLQAPDPYAAFRPHLELQYRFGGEDPLPLLSQLLDPARLQPQLQAAAASGAAVPAAGTTGPGATPVPSSATSPTPAVTPAAAAGGHAEGESGGPRAGSVGDVLGAVAALPQVRLVLDQARAQALGQLSRYWHGADTGERAAFVAASVSVAAGTLAPLLIHPSSRQEILPLLNGRVIPVPLLPGYGVEFNFGTSSIMVGVHVDVGQLLPGSWGFGPASFHPIGGPPQPEPGPGPVQRDAEPAAGEGPGDHLAGRIRTHQGGGRSLEPALRRRLEPALGADLSAVRIHHGAAADGLARELRAKAFTVGRDIFFRAGRYDPEGADGRQLLAHELAHTVQQSAGPVSAKPAADGLLVSTPGDRHEREADAVAELAAAPRPGSAPAGIVQRQPAGPKPEPARMPPPSAAAVKAAKPPPWTDYFDEVVPAVLAAVESNNKVSLKRALWLITQAYGEQSPGTVGLPSRHRNRLFNEQASMIRKGGKIVGIVPGQESEGVYLYNLPQNEATEKGKKDIRTSPTFGYDTPERAATHHLDQLQKRWGGAWNALADPNASFDTFAHSLKAAGYARAGSYDTDLIALQGQVRSQVGAWLKYRVPELRGRIPRMEQYIRDITEVRDTWQQWVTEGADPTGADRHQVEELNAQIAAMEMEKADAMAQLDRLTRFAGVLGLKV